MAQNQGQQGQGQGGQGGGGGRRGGGGGDPAAAMQFQLENIKQALGATDPEWNVLRPKVEKVYAARQEVQSGNRGGRGGGGGGGGRRGGGGGGNQPATNAVARALLDLQTTLENPNSTADQISQRLAALREAKAKAANSLAIAQKELKDLLTARQEAVLVTMNYLE